MFCFLWTIGMCDLSSLTMHQTHTPVWSLNQWTTREVPWSWADSRTENTYFFYLNKPVLGISVIAAQANEYIFHLYSFTPLGGLPSGSIVKNPPVIQETQVWSLGWEDPLERKWQPNPLQYSFLGNPMDRGAWQVTVHGVTKKVDMT